jgi:hypothetical protein
LGVVTFLISTSANHGIQPSGGPSQDGKAASWLEAFPFHASERTSLPSHSQPIISSPYQLIFLPPSVSFHHVQEVRIIPNVCLNVVAYPISPNANESAQRPRPDVREGCPRSARACCSTRFRAHQTKCVTCHICQICQF